MAAYYIYLKYISRKMYYAGNTVWVFDRSEAYFFHSEEEAIFHIYRLQTVDYHGLHDLGCSPDELQIEKVELTTEQFFSL